jgi:hypothetical protein
MKKVLFSFIIVAAGLFVTSCGNKSAESATEAEQTEQVAEEAPAAEAEQPASLADIVAKAKAEGANWSADEWKAQFKTALESYKTFAVEMNEAQPADLEAITKKYADVPALMEELVSVAQQAEGGKVITDEWIQTTMQEMGIPEL